MRPLATRIADMLDDAKPAEESIASAIVQERVTVDEWRFCPSCEILVSEDDVDGSLCTNCGEAELIAVELLKA